MASSPKPFYRDRSHRRILERVITPNWFAAVMGTGIVATAAVTLPVQVPGQRAFAVAVWVLAATLLLALTLAVAVQTARRPATALEHLRHPVLGHFYGAVPMALLTVGHGALIVLPHPLVALDVVLWSAGTTLGLVTTVAVPVCGRPGTPFGGWLMPVVPPLVSATTGAALVPHVPMAGALLAVSVACAGVSLLATGLMLPLIWGELLRHGPGAPGSTPTLFIVLGPLGQSVTAAGALATATGVVAPGLPARLAGLAAVAYGVPVWGFALVWLALASVLAGRAAPPFGLPWWSFTFPVGTVVTGSSALAARTGEPVFTSVAVLLFAALITAWATVLVRTVRNAGDLLAAPAPPAPRTVFSYSI